ncbi:hypothetical protein NQ318_001945 [Aromia moschata]|uniref:RRM domain-containing protein n=1 Tax=Aromia moschata TaxID=1265417 RepID=A0AAV8Z472_9CUCU|nr:hypothetical protein NQ318_001945 [Aromia moschata]
MPEKMSTSSQNNGKKSSNSSIANTPSSTPLTTIANGNAQVNTQSSPPPNNNAPKYGTLVPNRIFVGGISANTTESELMQLFSSYGTVKAAKIIQDRAGVSKGYGFITFESEDDAKRPLREAENIVLRERKLNIAPAIKKQPFSRAFDASSPPAVAAGNPAQFFFPPGAAMPYFQGGVAYYPQPAPAPPGDPAAQQPVYQPPPVYPAQTGPPPDGHLPIDDVPHPDDLHAAAVPHANAGRSVCRVHFCLGRARYRNTLDVLYVYIPGDFVQSSNYISDAGLYPVTQPAYYDYSYYQSNGGPPPSQYMVGGQGGPGGPQCPPLPPSSSPPRPPCYGQQVPTYSPADPMFYNLPVYGAAMEGPPIYTEAFDLGTNGPYSEDAYTNHMADSAAPTQDLETANGNAAPSPYITNELDHGHHHQHRQHHPSSNNNNDTAKAPANAANANPNAPRAEDARNSNTPVVSLLSIDQQQEKDYLSMQGGRRRKSAAQGSAPVHHIYPSNGYVNTLNSYAMGYHPQPYTGPYYQEYRRTNGVALRNKRRTYADENKNDPRPNSTPPPPAPYSPVMHQYKIIGNNTRNYHNLVRYPGNNYKPPFNNNNDDDVDDLDETKHASKNGPSAQSQSVVSQVHVTTAQAQGFAPPARRSRRSIRRSGTSGVGVSEIGAGDAPLPNEDVVCKKFETLKL